MLPESVVCWKWKAPQGYRSTFTREAVNVLFRSVARNFPHPHRFICVTDDPSGLDPGIDVVPIWDDFASVPSPHGGRNPSCYRRLRAFHPDIGKTLGQRFVSLDLDTVVMGDLTPLWDRPEEIVFWGDTHRTTHYNGSMFLMTAGARPQVWTEFKPETSPQQSKSAGCYGSDQGWISFILGTGEARWTRSDGVYSFRNDIMPGNSSKVPANARLIMFHGAQDPWGDYAQRLPWVKDNWR